MKTHKQSAIMSTNEWQHLYVVAVFESFWNWTKTQITTMLLLLFLSVQKGERSYKQTTTLSLQIAMILTFRWVRTFQWKRCVCVLLHRLGAVFIFFDNKLGNYSVMIKIYSTTRGMCACIYIGCVCTRAVYVWNGHWRNCILHGKKWEGSNEVPRTLVLLLVLVVVIYYMYRYQSANEGKISRC